MNTQEIEKEIKNILERNKRVEGDKAWETSWTRKIIITVMTYIVIVVFFLISKLPKPFLNALVPALAFILSTLTVKLFKRIWLEKYYKKN